METYSPKSSPSFILPAHSNKLALSIICTIFCCQIGGIVAIIYSSNSNSLYNSALHATDDDLRYSLYLQSEEKNRTARIWIIVSLAFGVLYMSILLILALAHAF